MFWSLWPANRHLWTWDGAGRRNGLTAGETDGHHGLEWGQYLSGAGLVVGRAGRPVPLHRRGHWGRRIQVHGLDLVSLVSDHQRCHHHRTWRGHRLTSAPTSRHCGESRQPLPLHFFLIGITHAVELVIIYLNNLFLFQHRNTLTTAIARGLSCAQNGLSSTWLFSSLVWDHCSCCLTQHKWCCMKDFIRLLLS